jgi:uncharacterized coiled-coil protein SlyX
MRNRVAFVTRFSPYRLREISGGYMPIFVRQNLVPFVVIGLLAVPASAWIAGKIFSQKDAGEAISRSLAPITQSPQRAPAIIRSTSVNTKSEDNAKLAELSQAIDKLQSQYEALNKKYLAAENNHDISGKDTTERNYDPQQLEEMALYRQEQTLLLLNSTLAAEEVDAEWSRQTKDSLRDVADRMPQHVNIDEVDCASTLCSLQASHSIEMSSSEFLGILSRGLDWEGEMYIAYDASTHKAQAYLGRVGSSLPSL